METIKIISDFMTGLGPTIMLPIVVFCLGVVLGQKANRALVSAITVGVGFVGLNLVIGLLLGALDPATKALIAATGVHLEAVDVGWGVGAAIAFSTTIGALIIPLAFGINILMLLTKTTKTLNVDMWNFWHFAFTGSVVYLVLGGGTRGLGYGLLAGGLHCVVSLVIGDLTAKRVQEFFRLPNISIPQGWCVTSVPIICILNLIVDRIPVIKDINWDEKTIREKLGVMGQPVMMGTVLGLLFGLLAYGIKKEAFLLAVQMAAVMLLVPRIIAIFMEGLTPLSEAGRQFMQKHFKGREFYIGLDSAILIGHPITIAAAIVLIPITLLLAFILPGNKVLPFADLAATAFFVCMVPPLAKGNLFRTILYGTFIMAIILYLATAFAPMITDIARTSGVYAIPEEATMISGLSNGNWIAWGLMELFKKLFGA